MRYLTFEEYSNIGGVLDLTAFSRYIDRACGAIDNATFGRLKSSKIEEGFTVEFDARYGKNTIDIPLEDVFANVSIQVKALCRDLVEYFAKMPSQISSHSQSAGGVSESYSVLSDADRQKEIDSLIKDYLMNLTDNNGTPLLYKGAMR